MTDKTKGSEAKPKVAKKKKTKAPKSKSTAISRNKPMADSGNKMAQNVRQFVSITNPVKKIYKKSSGSTAKSVSVPSPIYIPQYLPQPTYGSNLNMSDVLALMKSQPVANAPELSVKNVVSGSLPMNIPTPVAKPIKVKIPEVKPLPMEEAIPSTKPIKKKVNVIRPLPMEEAIPSTEPIKKKVNVIRPLPMEEAIPSTEPVIKNITDEENTWRYINPLKRSKSFDERTPSLFSNIPESEDPVFMRTRPSKNIEYTLEEAFTIIAKENNESLASVKRKYQDELRMDKALKLKGTAGRWRNKAKNIQFNKQIEQL
jgi:hypothetical protein